MFGRDTDAYGDRPVSRVGVGVGLLLILATGFAFGRGSAPGVAAAASVPAVTAQTSEPSAVPMAASLETLATMPLAVRGEAGARFAASTIDCILGGGLVAFPDDYIKQLGVIAAASASQSLQQAGGSVSSAFRQHIEKTAGSTAKVAVRCFPLAAKTTGYTDTAATVDVWALQIVAIDGRSAPTATYTTLALDLTWERNSWRLVATRNVDSSWAPATGQTPLPASASLPLQLGFAAAPGGN